MQNSSRSLHAAADRRREKRTAERMAWLAAIGRGAGVGAWCVRGAVGAPPLRHGRREPLQACRLVATSEKFAQTDSVRLGDRLRRWWAAVARLARRSDSRRQRACAQVLKIKNQRPSATGVGWTGSCPARRFLAAAHQASSTRRRLLLTSRKRLSTCQSHLNSDWSPLLTRLGRVAVRLALLSAAVFESRGKTPSPASWR